MHVRMSAAKAVWLVALIALTSPTAAQSPPQTVGPQVDLLLLDRDYLASMRGRVGGGDATIKAAVAALEEDAD